MKIIPEMTNEDVVTYNTSTGWASEETTTPQEPTPTPSPEPAPEPDADRDTK